MSQGSPLNVAKVLPPRGLFQGVRRICELRVMRVASPFVVFERDEVSSVAGSPPLREAGETATAGPQGPR